MYIRMHACMSKSRSRGEGGAAVLRTISRAEATLSALAAVLPCTGTARRAARVRCCPGPCSQTSGCSRSAEWSCPGPCSRTSGYSRSAEWSARRHGQCHGRSAIAACPPRPAQERPLPAMGSRCCPGPCCPGPCCPGPCSGKAVPAMGQPRRGEAGRGRRGGGGHRRCLLAACRRRVNQEPLLPRVNQEGGAALGTMACLGTRAASRAASPVPVSLSSGRSGRRAGSRPGADAGSVRGSPSQTACRPTTCPTTLRRRRAHKDGSEALGAADCTLHPAPCTLRTKMAVRPLVPPTARLRHHRVRRG